MAEEKESRDKASTEPADSAMQVDSQPPGESENMRSEGKGSESSADDGYQRVELEYAEAVGASRRLRRKTCGSG